MNGCYMTHFLLLIMVLVSSVAAAQSLKPSNDSPATAETANTPGSEYLVDTGVKIPLNLLNTISSKQAQEGDKVYLETLFPVLVGGKIVIPPGSYVTGTVTQVKRPGRIKGKGELYLRFDSLILPNGVTRDFRARIGGMDGGGNNELDSDEGKIKGGSSKGEDARTIGQAAQMGTMAGGIAGAVSGHPVAGIAGGAAGGAAAGLAGVLLTRGPDVVLPKGSMVEMVLDGPLRYTPQELEFTGTQMSRPTTIVSAQPEDASKKRPSSLWPFPF
jgi:hypothetical protein